MSGRPEKNSALAASAQLLVYSDLTLYEYRNRWSVKEASSIRQFWGVRRTLKAGAGRLLCCRGDGAGDGGGPSRAGDPVADPERAARPDQMDREPPPVKAAFELKLMPFGP